MSKEKICYVIMPFSPTESTKNWDKVYKNVFQPVIENSKFGYVIKRSELENGSFTRDIVVDLKNAYLTVADITDFNPNVMWELGVRHSLSKRTIMVARSDFISKIPSDIKEYGVIPYDSDITNYTEFEEQIHAVMQKIENNPEKPDSPVFNFLKEVDLVLSSQDRNKTISNLNGLLSELLFNLNFAEDIKKGERGVGLDSTTLEVFTIGAMDYLLSTNYLSADESFYLKILIVRNSVREINRRLDMILLDKRLKKDYGHSEKVTEKMTKLIKDIKTAIKEVNQSRKTFRKETPEFVEPPAIFFNDEHEKLLE